MKCIQNIRLIGQKVILVPYEPHHVPKYHDWMEDEELRQLTASERLSLPEEFQMQMKWRQDEDKCTFIILSKHHSDDGRNEIDSMIGDVNLFLVKDDSEDQDQVIAELEIMIADRQSRGQGLGREATIMMILYGIDKLHLTKFQVKISSGNTTSLKLFEKLGFEKVKFVEVFDEVTLMCDFADADMINRLMRDQCKFTIDAYQGIG